MSNRNLTKLKTIANACNATSCEGGDTNGDFIDELAMLAETGQLSGDGSSIRIDTVLDEDSNNAIANKAVAKLIPAEANSGNKLADKNYVINEINAVAQNHVLKEDGKGLSSCDFTVEMAERLNSLENFDDAELRNQLSNKVDKSEGKGLSTNDFTNEEKEKLANLSNFNDAALRELIDGKADSVHTHPEYAETAVLDRKVDKVDGKGLSTNDFTDEDKLKLDSLENNSGDESNTYKKMIDSLPYAQFGENTGVEPGYLRMYKKPNRICVIGNSITSHGFYEHDGISWSVPDYREMAASRPNSGWVSLIQQYITKNINPDCKVYKANGSKWEVGAEGARDYSLMAGEQAYEVLDTGSVLIDGFTIDNMLTEDTDIVLVQLSENMSISDNALMAQDFNRLFDVIKQKCPKAEIYSFLGFWTHAKKLQAIATSCDAKNVTPVFAQNLVEGITEDLSIYKAQTDDIIYDINGNQIATVSSAVAGHPNDAGFRVMATYFLDAMFNNRKFGTNNIRLFYKCNDVENPEKGSLDIKTSSYLANTKQFQDECKSILNYFVLSGKYPCSITSLFGNDCHAFIQVDNAMATNDGYNSVRQRVIPTNSNVNNIKEFYRNVVLGASDTEFGDMCCIYSNNVPELGLRVAEQMIHFDEAKTISSSSTTNVGKWDNKPVYILDAKYFTRLPSNSSTDYSNIFCLPRIIYHPSEDAIYVSYNGYEGKTEQTFPVGTILWIKYAY